MGRLSADDWARAALAALAEGGLAAVAVEPVAVRLGVSKGSFYWHFANRRALVEAALARWEAWTEEVIAGLEGVPDPVVRMRTLLEQAFGDAQDAAISFRLISEADDPVVGAVARRVSERRLAYMRRTLEEAGQRPEEAARRVLAGYGTYLGLAALVRVGAVAEVPPDLVEVAMVELGLTSSR
ncbi:DNA-binding transcriptional regulator, AcrR family [Nonomuraea solani]|uniref:DNA-binding transcriptional regulator, AcrR family n=1 Tax=Nonomuraea solani TaxID=1144553 RepID=A0A1H5SV64_9ACTN|nr:TetR/AcrR family transcriptional regulator [Nonomuraea solani]SEF54344.1 DNA-binding transcriptional regulator, AcrR family [Nonomuraea solani]